MQVSKNWKCIAQVKQGLQRDNPALQGGGGGFRSVLYIQFFQNVTDMQLDRDFGTIEGGGDLFITQTLRDHAQYFQFTSGQGAMCDARRQYRSHGRVNVTAAGEHLADSAQ